MVFPPLHASGHAAPDPQATLHAVAPEQVTVQPPDMQVTLQELLPWHVTVVASPTVRLQALVPSHVTVP
jgi:hypothetical protein